MLVSHVPGSVTSEWDDEETLRTRIKALKRREKRIREERHRLEAELRNKIFKKYLEIENKLR